jgi:predicted RNase H-like nuclease (RuvC/YqgF family)
LQLSGQEIEKQNNVNQLEAVYRQTQQETQRLEEDRQRLQSAVDKLIVKHRQLTEEEQVKTGLLVDAERERKSVIDKLHEKELELRLGRSITNHGSGTTTRRIGILLAGVIDRRCSRWATPHRHALHFQLLNKIPLVGSCGSRSVGFVDTRSGLSVRCQVHCAGALLCLFGRE